MNDSLEISTLGRVEIRRNGMMVPDFPTRKVEALLVYLACTGRPHPREQLAEFLWDDRSQAQSLTNLRATLSRLNEQLAPFLLSARKTVAIRPGAQVWVDAVELRTALEANRLPLSNSSAHRLERVLALYQGDFLAGFYINESQGFEEWLRSERERLRIGVMEAMSQLVAFHLGQASFDAGVVRAARLLELDPLREDAHRQMMTLLASKGQRATQRSRSTTHATGFSLRNWALSRKWRPPRFMLRYNRAHSFHLPYLPNLRTICSYNRRASLAAKLNSHGLRATWTTRTAAC